MVRYEFNVAQFIVREIHDRVVGTEKVILILLMHICLDAKVPELHDVDQFNIPESTTDFRLVRYVVNPKARKARRGAELLVEIYRSQGGHSKATRQNEIGNITRGGMKIVTHTSNTMGISSVPLPTQSVPPCLAPFRSARTWYVIISQSISNKIMHKFGMV